MPDKPIIGIRQLAPILVVDALFIVGIVASIMTGAGQRPYVGEMTLLQTLLIAFGIVSAVLTYWCIVRPMRRAQAARQSR